MEFNEKAESLNSVAERLCELLSDENAGLKARTYDSIRNHVEEKDRLCRALELLVKGLSKDRARAAEIDDHMRQSLRECGERLELLITDNATALNSAIQANEQLMAAIRDAAVECTPKAGNYTQAAVVAPGSRSAENTPAPVSFNQVL